MLTDKCMEKIQNSHIKIVIYPTTDDKRTNGHRENVIFICIWMGIGTYAYTYIV